MRQRVVVLALGYLEGSDANSSMSYLEIESCGAHPPWVIMRYRVVVFTPPWVILR